MRQKSRRTDIVIIIAILVIAVLAVVCSRQGDDDSVGKAASATLERYNGKTLGTMPGSHYEADTAKHFLDSPVAYYSGVPELYAALITEKIDGFVMSDVTLRQMEREHLNIA